MSSDTSLLPYLAAGALAFAAAWILPRGRRAFERAVLGAIAALTVLFVGLSWPELGGEESAGEWKYLLDVIVFLPIAGALGVLFLPRQAPKLLRVFTLSVLGLDGVASLGLLSAPMSKGWHFQHIVEWIPSLGIRYHVAVDGLSVWLILLATLTTPIAVYVSFGSITKRTKELCFAFLLLHAGMLGAFVALDLFLFFVFWELMLVPMVLLIGVWGGVERIKAAYKFFLYTMAGSMMMLAAILYLVWTHRELAGYFTFDYLALSRLSLTHTAAWWCFAGFALAFIIKVPMFPLHTWLPDAHVQAPTGGSIILAAVLLKLGTYGYLRFCMGMFAGPAGIAAPFLAGVAIGGGIVYGALVAWRQTDVKRLVAYSSVAHMGFVMLGLFAANQASVEGAILQMLNHGISTGALFLLVGVIYDRRHTREVSEFGGLAKVMPIYAALFVIVTMSSVGVPGTNGFVGEFMVIMGTFTSTALTGGRMLAGIAAFGVVLAAVYMLAVVQSMFFGPLTNKKNEGLPDVDTRERLALAPLVVLIFVVGFFPRIFLSEMTDSVEAMLERYRDGRVAHLHMKGADVARLNPRRGGPLERGYPKQPEPKPPLPEAASNSGKLAQVSKAEGAEP